MNAAIAFITVCGITLIGLLIYLVLLLDAMGRIEDHSGDAWWASFNNRDENVTRRKKATKAN